MYTAPRHLEDDEVKTIVAQVTNLLKKNHGVDTSLEIIEETARNLAMDKLIADLQARMDSLSVDSLFRLSEHCIEIKHKMKQEKAKRAMNKKKAAKKKPSRKELQ